jgi:hypothetical protein
VCSAEDVARIEAERETVRDDAVEIAPEAAAEILNVGVGTAYELVRLGILRARRERHKYGRRSEPLLTLDQRQVEGLKGAWLRFIGSRQGRRLLEDTLKAKGRLPKT